MILKFHRSTEKETATAGGAGRQAGETGQTGQNWATGEAGQGRQGGAGQQQAGRQADRQAAAEMKTEEEEQDGQTCISALEQLPRGRIMHLHLILLINPIHLIFLSFLYRGMEGFQEGLEKAGGKVSGGQFLSFILIHGTLYSIFPSLYIPLLRKVFQSAEMFWAAGKRWKRKNKELTGGRTD